MLCKLLQNKQFLFALLAFFIDFAETDPDVYENERVYQFCLRHNRTCPDPFSVPVVNMQSGDNPAGEESCGYYYC